MLAEPEPVPPIAPSDFKTFSADLSGFSLKPPEPNSEPEPPASDRYELTLRLEKGDTIDKMLADIDVPRSRPQADRTRSSHALLKKKKLAAGEEIELLLQTFPSSPTRRACCRCRFGRNRSASTSSRAATTARTTARRRSTR